MIFNKKTIKDRIGALVAIAQSSFSLFFLVQFIIFGLVTHLHAQTLPHYGVNCGQLGIEFQKIIGPGPGNGCDAEDCNTVKYQVYLKAILQSPHSGLWNLDYSNISLTIRMNPEDGQLSEINKSQTESCLSPIFNDQNTVSPEVDPDHKGVSMLLADPAVGEILPTITMNNSRSQYPLFTIVLNGFPGETFSLDVTTFAYLSNNTVPCSQIITSGNTLTAVTLPGTANPYVTLSLDMVNCTQPNTPDIDYFDVPIYLNNLGLVGTIFSLDFGLEVSTNAIDLANPPEIVGPYAAIGSIPKISSPVPLSNIVGYKIRVSYQTILTSNIQASNVLFYLRIHRPTNLTQAYTINCNLLPGRISAYGFNPNIPLCGATTVTTPHTSCDDPGNPVCSDFSVSVTANTPSCQSLSSDIKINWNENIYGSTIQLNVLKLRVDFDLEPGVTISSVAVDGIGACPTNNNPLSCGQNCLTYTDKSVILCVESASSITLTKVATIPKIIVTFNQPSGCVQNAKTRIALVKLVNSSKVCAPDVNSSAGFPLCAPMISGKIAREDGCYIDNVTIDFAPNQADPLCTYNDIFNEYLDACGPYAKCVCPQYDKYKVTPSKKGDLLNGLSTYDLVLISRHILGITPLNSPYKIIAADADISNGVTTFDIVEFRKIILGIYSYNPGPNQTLWTRPNWRFVDKNFVFSDPSNPFQPPFPEFRNSSNFENNVNFVGIKEGDLNLNAVVCDKCGAFFKSNEKYPFSLNPKFEKSSNPSGSLITIPVVALGEGSITAWQMGLRFDPNVYEFIGITPGESEGFSESNFGLSQVNEGIIRALWFATPGNEDFGSTKSGQAIFNVKLKTKVSKVGNDHALKIDDTVLPSLAWQKNDIEYAIIDQAALSERSDKPKSGNVTSLDIKSFPNPTSGAVTFDLGSTPLESVSIVIFDMQGSQRFIKKYEHLQSNQLMIQEVASFPSGVYRWEINTEIGKSNGLFVKQ